MSRDPHLFLDAVVAAHRVARIEFAEEGLDLSPAERLEATVVGLVTHYRPEEIALLAATAVDRLASPPGTDPTSDRHRRGATVMTYETIARLLRLFALCNLLGALTFDAVVISTSTWLILRIIGALWAAVATFGAVKIWMRTS